MMPKPRQPLFLARATYRKRRLRDGARLLPLFGLLLLQLPLLWPQTSRAYVAHWGMVFAIWAGLIALSAALSRGLAEAETLAGREDDGQLLPNEPPNPPQGP